MPAEPPDTFELSEVEARWPQICNEIISAFDLTEPKLEDFKRLDFLYQRCLMCVPGFQQETIDFVILHKCVLAAIQTIEHRWPDINPKKLRTEIGEMLPHPISDDLIDQAGNIAVCLWLGIDCVGPKHSMPKDWPVSDSICHFVLNRRFDDPAEVSIGDPVARFPPKFRAARLEEISGISIESTYYLDQHLRFNEDTRTLKIFMDAVWLNAMCERFRTSRNGPPEDSKETSRNNARTPIPSSQTSSSVSSSSGQVASKQPSQKKVPSNCDVHATLLAVDKRMAFKPGSCGRR
jgi:hypothetical protein